ncbi:MAG: hypothetical protein Q4G16_09850 [Cruoricaptor ignavus]|nr:hypothetical protein [Cruoricaptor ignavus]
MNIIPYIVDFLKKNQSVEIAEFGVFFMKDTQAKLDEFNKSILPPQKNICFTHDKTVKGDWFQKFVSEKERISEAEAEKKIHQYVARWNVNIFLKKEFSIEGLGNFSFVDEGLKFTEVNTETIIPDYYGLEEIDLKNLKQNTKKTISEKENYRINRALLWLLILIPIAGLVYLGITQQELIFGKKSFEEIFHPMPKETLKKEMPQPKPIIIDTLKVDSLKIDSLKTL